MSKTIRTQLTTIPLGVESLVSKDAIDSNPEILDFAKEDLLRQIKKYVASMEIDDAALSWTYVEEDILEDGEN